MRNLPNLQLLAAGMTAAQPARIERNMQTNLAVVNGDVLFQQYLANQAKDDATGSYGIPDVGSMAPPIAYVAACRIFASITDNLTGRNLYLALASSTGWGDCTPWGTVVFRQQTSAAWGSSAAPDAEAPMFGIARLTRRKSFRSQQGALADGEKRPLRRRTPDTY
jgi:hypothetical protein